MNQLKRLGFGALALATMLSAAQPAGASTIKFDALESAGTSLVLVSDPYSEAGFQIVDENQLFYAQQSHPQYAGSAGLHERVGGGLITLTNTSGMAFDLASIDLSILTIGGTSPAVTFTGQKSGGGSTTQSFTPIAFGFTTFIFDSSFVGLTGVSWNQGAGDTNGHQFDNIVVNAVPDAASSLTLLVLALGGIGALRGRQHKFLP